MLRSRGIRRLLSTKTLYANCPARLSTKTISTVSDRKQSFIAVLTFVDFRKYLVSKEESSTVWKKPVDITDIECLYRGWMSDSACVQTMLQRMSCPVAGCAGDVKKPGSLIMADLDLNIIYRFWMC